MNEKVKRDAGDRWLKGTASPSPGRPVSSRQRSASASWLTSRWSGRCQFAKRFRLFGDENGVMDGALCRRRKKYRRELPVNRCAGMASAWLSPIAAVVLVGLDQGWRAGGVHQRRNPTPCRDAEIPKPFVWRGLERRRAAGRHRMDVVPVRWRAALVCVFGRCKRGVLRSPGHASCTEPDACSPAVTAIGLPTQASRSRPISAG